MHITIELDGNESAGQLKRISAAVLAIGGVDETGGVQTRVVNVVGAGVGGEGTTTFGKLLTVSAGRGGSFEGVVSPLGAGGGQASVPVAPVSAAPLAPPAPSTAAADLFPSAPAAPQAGAASVPPVPAPPVPSAPVPPAPSAPVPQASPAVGAELDKDGLPWDARIHSSSKEKNKDGTWRQRRNLADGEKERVEQELRAIMAIPVGGMTLPLAATPTPANPAAVPGAPIPAAPVPSVTDKAPIPAPESGSNPVPQPPSPPIPAPPVPANSAPITSTTEPPVTPGVSTAVATSDAAPNVPPPPVTSAPSPVPPAAPAASSAGNPFGPLMTKISSNVAQGRLTEAQVHQALSEVGLQPGQITMLAARPDLGATVSARIDAMLAGAT